jgi:hypothetical protein
LIDSVTACTIFTVTDSESVFFCGNEDNSEAFQWRVWFNPETNTQYGRVFLGYRIGNNLDIPQAGFNDQGLAIDLNGVSYTQLAINPDRENFDGAFFVKWLEEFSTVNEVKENLFSHNFIDLETNPNQIHVADKAGNAVVIAVGSNGELNTTDISEDYLVSTNFNLNNKEQLLYELQHSGRYNRTATNLERLLNNNNLSVEGCRDILEITALNPNLGYGYVADLDKGLLYLYSHDDFERTAILNIHEELAKEAHSYAIETLVTQQTGIVKSYIQNSILLSLLIIITITSLCYVIYYTNLRSYLHEITFNNKIIGKETSISSHLKTIHLKYRFILACILSIISFILLKTFIKIGPIYLTFDWTAIFYIYLTFFPVLVISTNFRPSLAVILSSLGIITAELAFCLINGYGGELWIQLILSLSSLVGICIIISLLRKKNLLIAFVCGAGWYFIGFHIPAYFYYCIMFEFDPMALFLYTIAHVLIYFLIIPLVLLFNKFFRYFTQKQDLENILFPSE